MRDGKGARRVQDKSNGEDSETLGFGRRIPRLGTQLSLVVVDFESRMVTEDLKSSEGVLDRHPKTVKSVRTDFCK